MSFKKVTSLVLVISFVIIFLSTLVLYVSPPGFYSSWGGWEFLSISKKLWRELHITVGCLFFIFLFIHICYNFKLIIKYVKNEGVSFISRETLVSIIVVLFVVTGTACNIQPFRGVIELSWSLKKKWMAKYEKPPYMLASSSSLKVLASRTGMDLKVMLRNLKEKGYSDATEDRSLDDIAKDNKKSPNDVYISILGKD